MRTIGLIALFVALFIGLNLLLAVAWRVFSCGLWALPDKTFLERYGLIGFAALLSFWITLRVSRRRRA